MFHIYSGLFKHVVLEGSDLLLGHTHGFRKSDDPILESASGISIIDVSHFDTSLVSDMSYMFNNTAAQELDLHVFDTSNVKKMDSMFQNCSSLKTILVGDDFDVTGVTSSVKMFFLAPQLKGGAGTTYDANHTDKSYAHVDGGPSDPGYFTYLH